jgi:hypothetical protein
MLYWESENKLQCTLLVSNFFEAAWLYNPLFLGHQLDPGHRQCLSTVIALSFKRVPYNQTIQARTAGRSFRH